MSILANTPGLVSADTILADGSGRVWLTDFAEAGLKPLLSNFAALESFLRYDHAGTDLAILHQMEECLVGEEFDLRDIAEVRQPLTKLLRTILLIREHAQSTLGYDDRLYHRETLLQAAKRFLEIDATPPVTSRRLVQLAHLLLSMSMITTFIARTSEDVTVRTVSGMALRMEQDGCTVHIGNRRITIDGQSQKLFHALYQKLNQVCTRRDLGQLLFGEIYDDADESDSRRLNVAVFRLRQKIEQDTSHPCYILTDRGGYRLVREEQ